MCKVIVLFGLFLITVTAQADVINARIIHCDFRDLDNQSAPFWDSLGGYANEGNTVTIPSTLDSAPRNYAGPENPSMEHMIYCDVERFFKDASGSPMVEITIRRLWNTEAQKCTASTENQTMELRWGTFPLGKYSNFEYRFYLNGRSDQRRHVIYVSKENEFPTLTSQDVDKKCKDIAATMPKLNPCPWCP